jgi:hypothetical protein
VWLFLYIVVAHVGFFGIPVALVSTRLLSTSGGRRAVTPGVVTRA